MAFIKKSYTAILILALVLSIVPFQSVAAKKAKVKKASVTLEVGKRHRIAIKNKAKGKSYTFKSNKPKTASVTSSGVIRARRKGIAVITVKEVVKKKGKKAVARKIGTVRVTVKKKKVTPKPPETESPKPPETESPKPPETEPPKPPETEPPKPPETEPPEPPQKPDPPNGTLTPEEWATPEGYTRVKEGVTYGELKEITYYSEYTQKNRKCNILFPPNYSEDREEPYPVLYLLHGIGGDHNEWPSGNDADGAHGKLQYVIGNLYAEEEDTVEMIIVIPNVRARPTDNHSNDVQGEPNNAAAFDNFIYDLEDSLMPYIEANYPVSTKWEDTAIAGLSMGGRESLYIGFAKLDRFAYIGAFSSAPGLPDLLTQRQVRMVVDEGKEHPRMVMLCVGTSDYLASFSRDYHNTLMNNKVSHLWYEVPNVGHNFIVWFNGAYNFVKRIFKD